MGAKNLEALQIVSSGVPQDLTASGITGDYVSLKNYNRCLALVHFADGTATTGDITVSANQATDVAGTGAKALSVIGTGRIYTKQGADETALLAIGQWTAQAQTAGQTYVDLTSGEAAGLWAFEFKATDLDVDGGFDCLSLDVDTATGSAKLVSALLILSEPRQSLAPESMPTAIAD